MILPNLARSCSSAGPSRQYRCTQQCHARAGWRYLFCHSSRGHQGTYIYFDLTVPTGTHFSRYMSLIHAHRFLGSSDKGLAQPRMLGHFRRRDHPLWLCILPLRLACARESYPPNHHPIQSDRTQRPTLLQRLPPPGSCRTCLTLPATIYSS